MAEVESVSHMDFEKDGFCKSCESLVSNVATRNRKIEFRPHARTFIKNKRAGISSQ